MTAPDVVIVGGGPAGCATALGFARRGVETLLLEGPGPLARRLAGEWLHPAGARVLEELRVDLGSVEHCRLAGFVVHPDDGGGPIKLRYPSNGLGLSCRHDKLVAAMRAAVAACPGVTLLRGAKLTAVDGERAHVRYRDALGVEAVAAPRRLVVGADGRASMVRTALGVPGSLRRVSTMVGMLLEDVELPDPSFGHLIVGGNGVALIYHVGPRTVRLCLDLPRGTPNRGAVRSLLWDSYHHLVPAQVREPFRQALAGGQLDWASNSFRSRDYYGRGRTALVGDAVGCFHPLTAVGLTLGLGDAECLARSHRLEAYRRERTAATQVAELLAVSLHRMLSLNDPSSRALREAVYAMWRRSASERERTMALLAVEETHLRRFAGSFVHAASGIAFTPAGAPRPDAPGRGQLQSLGGWLSWLSLALGQASYRRLTGLGPERGRGEAPALTSSARY